jgi:flavin reductase (DIM6/NTAB) family NADH-FMN oxidoreductase RutF
VSALDPLPDSGSADADDLRRFFRRHAAAVAVVTATYEGAPLGLLVTSLASVSASPPLVSFNVSLTSSSRPALEVVDHLGFHVLAADQHGLADVFATKGADRFAAPTSWQPGPHGVPLLDGCAAVAVGRIEHRVPAGDHILVLARLLGVDSRDAAAPLLHHDGAYHRPVPWTGHSRRTGIRRERGRNLRSL